MFYNHTQTSEGEAYLLHFPVYTPVYIIQGGLIHPHNTVYCLGAQKVYYPTLHKVFQIRP